MINKRLILGLVVVFLLIGFVGQAAAQKSIVKLQGGRMVLRLAQCESVEKAITLINDNDVAMDVELSTSGELADRIELKEDSFQIPSQEEKIAYFTVTAPEEEGLTESQVNVKFTSTEEGGNSLGLRSNIIVITSEESKCGAAGNFLVISGVVLVIVLAGLGVYALNLKKKKGSGGTSK